MEQYIKIWQQATIDESRMDRVYQTEDLIPMIIDLEKKQEKLLRYKTLGSIIMLLALLIVFLNRMTITVYSVLGIGIFISSVLTIVILLNRLRFQISHEERSSPTLQLAEISESKIHAEKKIFTTYLPLFFVVALAGFNLMYVDLFGEEETGIRILYHLVMSCSLVIAFVVGLTVRIRRFHKQFIPVLDRIRKFKSESGFSEVQNETHDRHE